MAGNMITANYDSEGKQSFDPSQNPAAKNIVISEVDPVTGNVKFIVAGEQLDAPAESLIDRAYTTRRGYAAQSGGGVVPAGTVKIETRSFSALASIDPVDSNYLIMNTAEKSGVIFYRDNATRRKLYSFDGNDYRLVKDFSDSDYSVEQAFESIRADGVPCWFVVTHVTSANQAGMRVYKSADRGASWSVVFADLLAYGVAPSECTWSENGGILFGEYFENTPGRAGKIWYSPDTGATWLVHATTTMIGSHFHWAAAIDGTPATGWFVMYGDTTYAGMIKLQYVGGAFVEIKIKTNSEAHCIAKLKSGRWIKSETSIAVFDPVRYSDAAKFNILRDSDAVKYPYSWELLGPRTVFEYKGVLYAAFDGYGVSVKSNGLYASSDDGETWVCVYRDPSANFAGFRHGWGFGNYVYLQVQQASGVTYSPTVRIPALKAKLSRAARSDHPVVNRIATQALSTFTDSLGKPAPVGTANGGWGDDSAFENPANGAPALIEIVKGGVGGTGHMLHCRTKAAGVTGKNNIITSPNLSVLCAGNVPVLGDYFALKVKFLAPRSGVYDISCIMRGLNTSEQFYQIYKIAGSDWVDLHCWGRWNVTPTSSHRIWVRCDNPSSDAATNVEFDYYIGAVELYVSSDKIWVDTNRNSITGQVPTPDVIQIPAKVTGKEWTFFADLTESAAIEQPDGAVMRIDMGAPNAITISYTGGRYVISDGVNSAQSSARSRILSDLVRFAVVSDSIKTVFVIQDSSGSAEVVGSDAGIMSGSPRIYQLGGSPGDGSYTAGTWANIDEIDKSLSFAHVLELWKE